MVARIVFAWTPRVELDLRAVVQRRRQRDDCPDVQVGVSPAIEAVADTCRVSCMKGGVSQRTRNADAGQLSRVVDAALNSDDRIES